MSKNFEGIPHSDYMNIARLSENDVRITVEKPWENMQADTADFDAIGLMCKLLLPWCKKVEISFEHESKVWNRQFGNLDKFNKEYLRFLYRLGMFAQAFPGWVDVAPDSKTELTFFQSELSKAAVSNNIPDKVRSVSSKSDDNSEHLIEMKLAHSIRGREHLKQIYSEKTGNSLRLINSQLPNGLFSCGINEEPKESNRIFTTGYYDIWGLDNCGDFCIFELKKDEENKHLGVISELFFYAAYARDILIDANKLHKTFSGKNYRGYQELFDAVSKEKTIKSVKAFFLFGEGIHKLIEENSVELINLMNSNALGIHFDILQYDATLLKSISREDITAYLQ
jgi:hypothetical protein